MDCTNCLWLASNGENNICLKRDHLKADEDTLSYPENPGHGCDEKEILVNFANGDQAIVKGAQIFLME